MLNEQKDEWVKLSCLQPCMGFSCLSKEFVVNFCFNKAPKVADAEVHPKGRNNEWFSLGDGF
jgi:hypothetical protein